MKTFPPEPLFATPAPDRVRLRVVAVFLALGLPLFALVWGMADWLSAAPDAAGTGAALGAFGLGLGIAAVALALNYRHDRLGLCNVVTQVRLALAAVLMMPVIRPGMLALDDTVAWSVVAIAAFAFALDGVDGWLARQSGLSSSFGARFDMEVDALLALILALLVYESDKAGIWVLALGFARYAFVLASWLEPRLRASLPESLRRKSICVFQIGTLIVLLAPPIVPPVSTAVAVVAVALVGWSFAIDSRWLLRRR